MAECSGAGGRPGSLQATGATHPGHMRGWIPAGGRVWLASGRACDLSTALSACSLCCRSTRRPGARASLSNIRDFLRGCGVSLQLEKSDANDLYQGQNFNKVLSSLVMLNKVIADIGLVSDSMCAWPSSHRIKSSDSLGPQPSW